MSSLYPLTFQPIFKGARLGRAKSGTALWQKLPAVGFPSASPWEISDRPGDVSVIANGPLAGKTCIGSSRTIASICWATQSWKPGGSPLLIKLLDAQENHCKVHPPASKAAELRGDPKTEMWFIADAIPNAELYVGLKRGVTRAGFRAAHRRWQRGGMFSSRPSRAGDSMFLPSGRVHAIGSGLVIFEIQQNPIPRIASSIGIASGWTASRELHVPQSLASIDFNDFEPALVAGEEIVGQNFRCGGS